MSSKKVPTIKTVDNVPLPAYESQVLENGIPFYIVNKGTQLGVRLDFLFRAGRFLETKKQVSKACASLLKEGSEKYTDAAIDDIFDYYGASIRVSADLDFIKVTVFCLTKHLETLCPYILDIILNPLFNKKELNRYKRNVIGSLKISLEKNEVVAYRELTEKLYGPQHPYGYNSTFDGYNELNRSDLESFHRRTFIAEHCQIYLAGGLLPESIELIHRYFSNIPKGKRIEPPLFALPHDIPERVEIKGKQGSNQAALRLGRRSINKNHPDYAELLILNTLLGGYFGSRLMMNIREEKGYTYNIFSAIDTMLHDAYFYIGAEVNRTHLNQVLDEIFLEVEKLKTETIAEQEFTMLKNYLLGTLLNMVDGPIYISQTLRSFFAYDAGISAFENMIHTTRTMTPERLQFLANKYLNMKHVCCVTVL